MVYGRVGFINARIESAHHAFRALSAPGFTPPLDLQLNIEESKKRSNNYLRLGMGLEHQLSKRWALRGDYVYTNYRKISFEATATVPAAGLGTVILSDVNQASIHHHALTMGLSYYLSCQDACYARNCRENAFTGVYVGGALGGAIAKCDVDGSAQSNGVTALLTAQSVQPKFQKELNFRGRVLAGAGLEYDRLYGGLELFANYAPYSRDATNHFNVITPSLGILNTLNTITTQTKIHPWQFGILARPGILLTRDTLLYATVGTAVGKISARVVSTAFNPNYTTPLYLPLSQHATRASLQLGCGVEYALKALNVRADYIYSDFGHLEMSGVTSGVDPNIGSFSLQSSSRIHFTDQAVTLGVSFYI